MTQEQVSTQGSLAIEKVAEHYAKELNAQFRTLNHFVNHAGEIGRAHETFLRGILARFLPGDVRISSGFVASPKWTSRQQDILIYKHNFSTLFEVGDCTVIDHNAFIGAIEVKSNLSSKNAFGDAIEAQAELPGLRECGGLHGIYAWEAVSLSKTLEAFWDFVRLAPTKNFDYMPDIVYVRGKYLLLANRDGHRDSSPYHSWLVGRGGITEGQALLGVVASVWRFGFRTVLPWWLLGWHSHFGIAAGRSEEVLWPEDLKKSVMADIE